MIEAYEEMLGSESSLKFQKQIYAVNTYQRNNNQWKAKIMSPSIGRQVRQVP